MAKRRQRTPPAQIPPKAPLPGPSLSEMLDLFASRGDGSVTRSVAPEPPTVPLDATSTQRTAPVEDRRLAPEKDPIEGSAADFRGVFDGKGADPISDLTKLVDTIQARTHCTKCGAEGERQQPDGSWLCVLCNVPKNPTKGWKVERLRRAGVSVVGLTEKDLDRELREREGITFDGDPEDESTPLLGER